MLLFVGLEGSVSFEGFEIRRVHRISEAQGVGSGLAME